MKENDLYSYALIHIATHGFEIKAHTGFSYPIEIMHGQAGQQDTIGLKVHDGVNNPHNPWVYADHIGIVHRDHRAVQRGDFNVYILVYKSGASVEEVYALARPQMIEIVAMQQKAFEEAAANAKAMVAALQAGSNDLIIPPAWMKEQNV